MSKSEANNLKKISVGFLKEHGYFKSWKPAGVITWTRNNWGEENKSSVGIEVSIKEGEKYLRIYYTQTDLETQEKKDFDYKIPLTTTPCRYGGVRYWFVCPCYKNGVYCGKRVAKLYKNGDYFACRHCYNLTYESRNQNGIYRSFVSEPDVEEAWNAVKRTYYRGKPTRKYKRYLKLREQCDRGWIETACRLDKRLARLINKKK